MSIFILKTIYGSYIDIRMICFLLHILQHFEKLQIIYNKIHFTPTNSIVNKALALVFEAKWNLSHEVFIKRETNGCS